MEGEGAKGSLVSVLVDDPCGSRVHKGFQLMLDVILLALLAMLSLLVSGVVRGLHGLTVGDKCV